MRSKRWCVCDPESNSPSTEPGQLQEDVDQLRARGISRLVSLVGAVPESARDWQQLTLDVDDAGTSDLRELVNKVRTFVKSEDMKAGSTLVFCNLAVNRSPAVLAAYLMVEHGWTLSRALGHLGRLRPGMSIHPRYLEQLGRLTDR